MRLTHDGLLFLALTIALTGVAIASANNVLMLIAAPLWSLWLLQWPAGVLNLRGIEVRRVLPAELYAEHDSGGAWLVANRRRWFASHSVEVDESHAVPVLVGAVAPGQTLRMGTAWRFPRRGEVRLQQVFARSSWPLGLVEHTLRVSLPADVLVYPRPLPGERDVRQRRAPGALEVALPGGTGDFIGLRSFRQGDAPQRVNWAASARVGRPMVVERAREQERAVHVALRSVRGRAWERELSRACGDVQRAARAGDAVGLLVPADDGTVACRLSPLAGLEGRRRVLDTLARLPERP
jgi:uncharacterized protein (DUF58 family)